MFKKITWTVFNGSVVLISTAAAVWLTATGHTLLVEGLLMGFAGVLAAVIFALRLAEGSGPDHLSIWVGPFVSPWRATLSADEAH
jgi:hypothetical protein